MHEILAKQILSSSNGMNLYRGCTHGCIYCDSRSTCYQINHDFEDIAVKINAVQLLENALSRKQKRCMIGTGAMCDPYLHAEKDLRLTRKCLEVINRYNFGVGVLTKSDLVMRDIDLFKSINSKTKAVVQMTLTTFDDELCKKIEPNVCPTSSRIKVLQEMKKAGIPTMVWLDPFLPFINDTQQN
ncbi:MAG: radical SAM protein, partial [Spirochaetota bacterium]|nr:radical SAM protein [Spirochaetota bacterium]